MSGSKGRSRSERDRAQRGKAAPAQHASGAAVVLEVSGWALYFHPLFLDQLDRLISAAEAERARRASAGAEGPNTRLVAHIETLVFADIPSDPTRREYRQGNTLGEERKHWFQAKFEGGRFRLFFRYRSDIRVIVFVWVNDQEILRTYGSRTDAYAVFGRMLDAGNPPDDWTDLMRAVRATEAANRMQSTLGRMGREREG